MTTLNTKLSHQLELSAKGLDRSTLKNQIAASLRDSIIRGKIPQGSKVVEREVAESFGISRAPARDALMQLEKEGLIISKTDARYVIELSERDISELHQVRQVLETLAVQLAAKNTSLKNQQAQLQIFAKMEDAVDRKDSDAFARADLDGHELIWEQADNPHLERTLHTMLGPIFMFMANASEMFGWLEPLELHRDIVHCINSGDQEAAADSIRKHLDSSKKRSLSILSARQKRRVVENKEG